MNARKVAHFKNYLFFLTGLFSFSGINLFSVKDFNQNIATNISCRIHNKLFSKNIILSYEGIDIGNIKTINFLKCAILYDFYIVPEKRGKGYGKLLLNFACNTLKHQVLNTIFIQPGPFEIESNNEKLDEVVYKERTEKLIKLYSLSGFVIVPKYISILASILYKIIGLDENPYCLMMLVQNAELSGA